MSEDALNDAIAAKWAEAGLNAEVETTDNPPDDEAPVTDDDEPVIDPATDDDASAASDDETPAEADPAVADAEADAEVPPVAEVIADASKKDQDELAEALGLGKPPEDPKKRAQWWKTRVPYSQLHKVVVEREKKLAETHTGVLKERDDRISQYDTRFSDVKKVEDLITNSPDQYVKTLVALFPETYGKMFAPILGTGTAAAAKIPDMTEDPGPKPEPDMEVKDAEGRVTGLTYGVEGYQKLMDWQQKVTEQNMLKRFKPHLDFVDAQKVEADKRQKEAVAEQAKQQALKSSEAALAEVETWDMGKENLNEILAEAAKLDPSWSAEKALFHAYRKVVHPKMKASRDEMQAQIVKDLKKTSAKQTAAGLQTPSKATAAVANTAPTDIDTRIKAAWKRQGLI